MSPRTRSRRTDPGTRDVLAVLRAFVADLAAPVPAQDGWLDAAEQHGVLAVVAALLERAGHRLPPAADRERLRSLAHQLRTLTDLRRVGAVLDDAGVGWLVMKGPALAWLAYGGGLARPSSDLDVLVAPADFEHAVASLTAAGATERDEPWSEKVASGHGEVGLDLDGGLHLDLHWSPTSVGTWRERIRLDAETLLARSVTADLGGVRARTLDPLDTLVHLGVHGCLSGGDRLRWLLDMRQSLTSLDPSPDDLAARAIETQTVEPLWLMVERAERYLDPGLARWRRALPVRRGWAAVSSAWSAAFPPGRGFDGRLSGRALYMSAAQGSEESLRRALSALTHRATRRDAPHGSFTRTADRDEYYAFVRRYARR